MVRPPALSKADAMKQISTEVENWVEAAIVTINDTLTNFTSGQDRTVQATDVCLNNLPFDARARAVKEIVAYYQAAGWKVAFDSGGQTDNGGWFNFS